MDDYYNSYYREDVVDADSVQPTLTVKVEAKGCWAFVYTLIIPWLDAFVVWLLWSFFVVPLHVVAISYWEAMGLSLFASYMLMTASTDEPEKNPMKAFLRHLGIAVVVLVMSLAIHSTMGGL